METNDHSLQTNSRDSVELIEDYLDRVCGPLVAWFPYAERHELRQEIRAHLMASAEAYQELGEAQDSSLASALRQMGDPAEIGRQYLDSRGGFGPLARVTRAGAGATVTLIGGIVGILAMLAISKALNVTPTADHSEFAIGANVGAWVGWTCRRKRAGARMGACYGALAGLASFTGLLTINTLLMPSRIGNLIADWAMILAVLLDFVAISAVCGGVIGCANYFLSRIQRSPSLWVIE